MKLTAERRSYHSSDATGRQAVDFHISNSLCLQIRDIGTEATSARDFIKGTYDLVSHSRTSVSLLYFPN
jgi:hypothetical protein